MPSYQEIIDRAQQIAVGRGIDPHQSPVIDGQMTFEALVPHCVRYEVRRLARRGEIQDLVLAHSIPIIANVGLLPGTILREFLKASWITDKPRAAFIPYERFAGYRFDAQLDYYSVLGNKIHFREAGTETFTDTITLNAPSIPNLNSQKFLPAHVDSVSDTITLFDGHTFQTGEEVYLTSTVTSITFATLGSSIAGLRGWVIRTDATHLQISASQALAHAGTADNITAIGAGVHTITDALNVSERIIEDVILLLASVMTGEMKLAELLG